MADFSFTEKLPKGAIILTMKYETDASKIENTPKEGDLYKVVTTFGKSFELRYGFYEERDRLSPLCEPAIIYPDFIREPILPQFCNFIYPKHPQKDI